MTNVWDQNLLEVYRNYKGLNWNLTISGGSTMVEVDCFVRQLSSIDELAMVYLICVHMMTCSNFSEFLLNLESYFKRHCRAAKPIQSVSSWHHFLSLWCTPIGCRLAAWQCRLKCYQTLRLQLLKPETYSNCRNTSLTCWYENDGMIHAWFI